MLKSKKSKFIVFSVISIVALMIINPVISNLNYFFGLKGEFKFKLNKRNITKEIFSHSFHPKKNYIV